MAAVNKRRGVASIPVEKALLWKAFCERHNVERSKFCEHLGEWLAAHQEDPPPFLVELIEQSAKTMVEKRRRG